MKRMIRLSLKRRCPGCGSKKVLRPEQELSHRGNVRLEYKCLNPKCGAEFDGGKFWFLRIASFSYQEVLEETEELEIEEC